MKRTITVFALFVTVFAAMLLGPGIEASEAQTEKARPGWKLVWSDEFDGPEIDRSVWNYEIGHIRNKEPQYYTDRKENSYIKEGNLVIETRLEEFKGAPYTSASLNTMGRKSFQYARFEMRAKLPHGPAIWPAFWSMGINGGRSTYGEIDIMEMWGGENRRVGKDKTGGWGDGVSCTAAHWYDNETEKKTQNVCNWVELPAGKKCADDYHLYAVEWDENEIVWYFDETVVDRLKIETEGQKRGFRQPHYLLINTAIAPYVKPGPTPEMFPTYYMIDHIRVYQKDEAVRFA